MVLLTLTPAAKAAIRDYCRHFDDEDEVGSTRREMLSSAAVAGHVEHHDLVHVSQHLLKHAKTNDPFQKQWRLDTMLKGATLYYPPPPPKAEPTPEYKALMQRLRQQEEQRQYERMINPLPPRETFSQRFPNATTSFGSSFTAGTNAQDEIDEVTYADVNRQIVLIINVLVSIIACSVTIWMAARRWSVPQRLALALSGSTIVAFAEVVIYMGYIRRIKEAKAIEAKKVERKEIVDTWVIDGNGKTTQQAVANEALRFRKGKHR